MKFKYVGKLPRKSLDLALHGIVDPSQVMLEGFIFEIPDNKIDIIEAVKINGNYEVYNEPKKVVKPKKEKKEDKED